MFIHTMLYFFFSAGRGYLACFGGTHCMVMSEVSLYSWWIFVETFLPSVKEGNVSCREDFNVIWVV